MRLRSTLVQIAALASASVAACSSTKSDNPPSSFDDAGVDNGPDPIGCGGCNCGSPAVTQGEATLEQACAIASSALAGDACQTFCRGLNDGGTAGFFCTLPATYTKAFDALQSDGGADGGPACPESPGGVLVQCGYACLGRRTAGLADPDPCNVQEIGAVLANRAYLEAVSVHAFARLERELAFHGAPLRLLRAAKRAQRDEIRHTAMTARLARRFGGTLTLPSRPQETPARGLFEIARENAVEGCVREMYGAVMGLVEAASSSDVGVRSSARRIAVDECRHGELAMDIMRWVGPKLTSREREAIDNAVAEAVAELAVMGNNHVVELLDANVWRGAFAA